MLSHRQYLGQLSVPREELKLRASALRLLIRVLAELTTQQAADLSRAGDCIWRVIVGRSP